MAEVRGVCGLCFEDKVLVPPPCEEKPEKEIGGMYHCPDCGMMLVPRVPHSWVCRECIKKMQEPQIDHQVRQEIYIAYNFNEEKLGLLKRLLEKRKKVARYIVEQEGPITQDTMDLLQHLNREIRKFLGCGY